jgi:phosphohistidine swiveling domain-containing protein
MGETAPIAALLESIAAEFGVTMGRPERVAAACAAIRERLARPPTPDEVELLLQLAPLLRQRAGPLAVPAFELLEEVSGASPDAWPLLDALLGSRDGALARRALDLALRLARAGSLALGRPAATLLAERVEAEGSGLVEPAALATIAGILRARGETPDPVLELYLEANGPASRLAARLLDLDAAPAPPALAERVLGASAHAVLGPYLGYTRASHLDLLQLVPDRGFLASLRRAERACGESLLRDVIGRLGWARVNLGLEVRPYVGVSLGDSLPFLVSPAEAPLLEACAPARRTADFLVVISHGGPPGETGPGPTDAVVARFRVYNLAHAEALADILDVAPLTPEKVHRILERMDRIVEGFCALFAEEAAECGVLPGLYRELRERVLRELAGESSPEQLSAELTRLVQSFEDPRSVGEVRTVHGLKRFLHQRGLRLGLRLVAARGATNRTVDLVVASGGRVVQALRKIAYVDFEPEDEAGIPYAVALIAEGFVRQLLHGQESFPSVQVFCYGDEVHHYLSFKNHPAFLRIDYAPPLLGGMIDLEYYGVSVYEQSVHPNPTLDALLLFLRRLEFDVRLEGTRVHARYDKERALDLGDLCEKAELLACLVPYLMDLDWIIGSLGLDVEGRRAVAEAWSASFARWGVLPLRQLLTRDRQHVSLGAELGPTGERELWWSGVGPLQDRFAGPLPAGCTERLQGAIAGLGLDVLPLGDALAGQLRLERQVLRPLREALARGQLVATADGLRGAPAALFERVAEAEAFAELLGSDDLVGATGLAALLAPLERTLRFRTTGRVNGHEVQAALLALRGEALGVFVLRDPEGMARLALFAHGRVLCRRRRDPAEPWQTNWCADPGALLGLLRRNSCLPPGAEAAPAGSVEEAWALREAFSRPSPVRSPCPLPGERVLQGLRAAPGRAVGKALFGTAGRSPAEFDGAVLVAPAVRPEDNAFLYHSAGIVSTGGGILSHAGLIALQFHKPALIVPGRWLREPDGSLTLLYRTAEYRPEEREVQGCRVSIHRDWREREHRLREGDLVVLEVAAGTLQVLGKDSDALALHAGFQLFGEAGRRLAQATDEQEFLALRGRRLRSAHQLRKLLGRLADPVLARHAAHELLAGQALAGEAPGERAQLLSLLLDNPHVGAAARERLVGLTGDLARRLVHLLAEVRCRVPVAASLHEVLAARLEALHLDQALGGACDSLRACGIEPPAQPRCADLDEACLRRLGELRAACAARLQDAPHARRRHLLRQLERLDLVLGAPGHDVDGARARLAVEDAAARRRLAWRRVLAAGEGGFELHPLIGWKAANLAEVERLGGAGLVPPWFVVTDRAFEEALDSPLERADGASTLREAIAAILGQVDLDDARKSATIRALWDRLTLPDELAGEVVAAYRRLAEACPPHADEDPAAPFVAIRSSAREEDAEAAARAGEFDTFLFVRGEVPLLEFLKRAWSGLWTERAIHNRARLGLRGERAGGGVIVQRIVRSRVSGVLQTVNVAEGELREIVINAGLGLGEGIVSGRVAADHVVVAREGDLEHGPLRFRYVTADKREQVVFDRRAGAGTMSAECLYHQRLRPALEYVELSELVRVAVRLEADYGYPLDLEFGIEGSRLSVLQARPVATFLAVLRETLEQQPLAPATAGCAGERTP